MFWLLSQRSLSSEKKGGLAAKHDSGVTEDGVALEAVIRGFPVLTGLTEPSWCWVSIQAAGLGVLWSSSVLFERG